MPFTLQGPGCARVAAVPARVGLGSHRHPGPARQCSKPYKNACCQRQRKSLTDACTAGFLPLTCTRQRSRPSRPARSGPPEPSSVHS